MCAPELASTLNSPSMFIATSKLYNMKGQFAC